MNHPFFALVLLSIQLLFAPPCFGQDVLAEHKVKGLKDLRNVAVVLRPNTPREIASLKEWGDMVELRLHRHVPELKISKAENAPAWIELSIVTSDSGGLVELSVYRWVKVLASGEEIFAKVWWDSRLVFGGSSKATLQGALDDVVTSFAADYLRARR